MKTNKKAATILIFIILMVLDSSAKFYFQDDTLTNSLRVCNITSCENLENSNTSTVTNITSAYETGGSRLNPDINAFTFQNIWFIVGGVILLGMVVIFWRYMRR